MQIAPDIEAMLTALRGFLLTVVPDGAAVIVAQDNRVPEPVGSNFVMVQQPNFVRLRTDTRESGDVRFTGSISGTTMTVSDVQIGDIEAGQTVFGVGVSPGTKIVAGSGLAWTVSISQTVAEGTLSSGDAVVGMASQCQFQLDVHGPLASQTAQIISTLFRDEYATGFFAEALPGFTPLYADDPRQMAFVNEQQQYEDRWVVDAMLQVDQVVHIPQQYADSAEVELISVDAEYPPT